MVETVTVELLGNLLDPQFRADGARPGNHHVGERGVGWEAGRSRVDGTHQHSVAGDDRRGKASLAEFEQIGDGAVERQRVDGFDELGDATTIADRSVGRQAQRGPRGAPADQVVDLLEPELVEPPRQPGTQVAVLVEAVHEHRLGRVEVIDLGRFERLARSMPLRPSPEAHRLA